MSETLKGWAWNDVTNTLEYISGKVPLSGNQVTDRQDKKGKEKRQLKHEARSAGQRTQQVRLSPVRQAIKPTVEHTNVTLQDVKGVAEQMMREVKDVSPAFSSLLNTEQFDEFLLFLLNYFHWFFEKRAKECNPNPVHIEPSLAEKQYYEELCVKLEAAQKQLGRAYGALILGIGLCDHHHMACGRSRVSNTYRDRYMYENLYSFSTFVVWIAFKRKEHDVVKNEINRMLRTDTFNPALRIKMAPDDDMEPVKEERLTIAEYRRKQSNRPPLKAIVNQRSTTVVSICPLPREEASWLFKRQLSHSPTSVSHGRSWKEANEEDLERVNRQLEVNTMELKLGIIGEPLSLFDPVTLLSLNSDETEDGKAHAKHADRASVTSDLHKISSGDVQQKVPAEKLSTDEN